MVQNISAKTRASIKICNTKQCRHRHATILLFTMVVLGISLYNIIIFQQQQQQQQSMQNNKVFDNNMAKLEQTSPPKIITTTLSINNVNDTSSLSTFMNESNYQNSTFSSSTNNNIYNWWKPFVMNISVVYQPHASKNNFYSWCIAETSPSPTELPSNTTAAIGLLYIKNYKASSSTCEGVNLQMAHRIGQRIYGQNEICIHYNRHEFANAKGHAKRSLSKSLLWSVVRHPAKRDVSQFFHFQVSRNEWEPTNDNIIQRIQTRMRHVQTHYLSPLKKHIKTITTTTIQQQNNDDIKNNSHQYNMIAKYIKGNIFDKYDFIGITERLTESLACMVLLWNLRVTDVIVLNAKQANGNTFDAPLGKNAPPKKKVCRIIQPSFFTKPVENYLSTRHKINNADYLLYDAAVASLERTIQYLGPDKVQNVVNEIKMLQQKVVDKCQSQAIFPCSAKGELQLKENAENCYLEDAGCAYKCVNEILNEYDKKYYNI